MTPVTQAGEAAPAHADGAVLPPLRIGRHVIESPVVLAPMAGITNRAFRRLCREYGNEGRAIGGASGQRLFVTTSYENMTPEERAQEPEAGRVFAVEVGVGAPPVRPYRGELPGFQG